MKQSTDFRLAKKARLLMMSALMLTSSVAFAQNALSGRVVDANGEPVIGANVKVDGTNNGSVTDINGNFRLSSAPGKGQLTISYVGYKTQNVALGKSSYSIVLEEDRNLLDDIVVVGYGVQRKSDVTGALTRVSADDLNTKPVTNAFEALQGKAAGVDITSNQRPGELGSIRIRGNRSLNASNDPLYVVDGVPLNAGGIESLNPQDIESVDILKDASSTAIYGSRGANGVVLVTTKRGKVGEMRLNYSGSVTIEKIKDKSPAMNASDYITWRRWAYYNSNPTANPMGDAPSKEKDMGYFAGDQAAIDNVMRGWEGGTWDPSKVVDTDWTKFVTQTGVTTSHTLSASGGTEKIQGFVSVGYLNNKGTQKGQEYKRYNFSATTDIQAKPWFKMGGSINASYSEQDYGYSRTGQSGTSTGPTDIYGAAKNIPRYCVPYDANGNIISQPGGSEVNCYTVLDEWSKSTNNRQNFRAIGSFYGQLDFGKIWEPLEGLTYRIAFGPDFRYARNGIFLSKESANRIGGTNYTTRSDNRDFAWTLDNQINYTKQIGKHNIGVTLLQSATKYNRENSSMHEEDILLESFLWNNMGNIDLSDAKYKATIGTGLTERKLASYMARINYSFNDRYLLTISGRYDGSSVLAAGNKWAFFPSAAVGWRMEQEDFMKDIEWIHQLKLRFGVGTTGNSSVNPYGTLGAISTYWMPFSQGNSQVFVTNEPYYSNSQNLMPNKDLKWEKTTQWNYGVDFSFLGGRLGGTIDVYHSKTKDLLMNRSISSLSGYPATMANIGETSNFGVDITINATPVKYKGFEWYTALNASYQKDKIDLLANGKEDDIANNWFIGESIGVIYGIDNAGLWKAEDQAVMDQFNANGAKFEVGMVRPVDQNGDFKIDADDRKVLGSTTPRWTGGWTNTFSWKGIELNVELFGRFGYMISTGGEGQLGMYQQREIDYWRPDNPNAEYQKPIYSKAGGDPYSSLLGIKDASFIKIRNISLGYNLPKSICRDFGISNLKVYMQGRNLGNLYSSVDFMDLDMGATFYNRGFTLGLNVGF